MMVYCCDLFWFVVICCLPIAKSLAKLANFCLFSPALHWAPSKLVSAAGVEPAYRMTSIRIFTSYLYFTGVRFAGVLYESWQVFHSHCVGIQIPPIS